MIWTPGEGPGGSSCSEAISKLLGKRISVILSISLGNKRFLGSKERIMSRRSQGERLVGVEIEINGVLSVRETGGSVMGFTQSDS